MISWTIQSAIESNIFTKIVVSTEDEEIAAISKQCGAEVLYRPEALADDDARVVDVCLQALDSESSSGREYDYLCCLYPTAPFRDSEDIKNVMELATGVQDVFVLAVTNYTHPAHQALKTGKNNTCTPMWKDLVNKRDDEISELVVDNGSTYAVPVELFRECKSFYGQKLKAYKMPINKSIDINSLDDFEMAEYFFKQKHL